MLIAREKEEQNIVEYVLYMWQMEDLVRGCEMSLERVMTRVFPKGGSEEQKREYEEWFSGLIQEMLETGLIRTGHVKNVKTYMKSIESLHQTLITVYQDNKYLEIHRAAAPYIADLQKKSGAKNIPDTEVCLTGLYGLLLLKLSGQEISPDTQAAMGEISRLMAYLAESFNKLKKGELKFPVRMNN